MLSEDNISELETRKISYVVGARIGNSQLEEIKNIAKELDKKDKRIVRRENIIYEYSLKRARKDKADNDKQIKKAEYYLTNPAKVLKRSAFLTNNGKKKFSLNFFPMAS